MPSFSTDSLERMVSERGLVFPRQVLAEVVAALDAGKHIMLSGPPGTGKTSLAYLVADLAREAFLCTGYLAVTASADWSVSETIGHYTDSPQGPVFEPGVFLQSIETGQWLVIDEFNRADLDRAFGPLFTVLADQPVTLPYKQVGHTHPMSIVPAGAEAPPDTEAILVPEHWRIVATMNEFDKASLHRLSYALMRRFAFIEVGAPLDHVIRELIEGPGSLVADLLPVRGFVELGPALYIDAARFAARRLQEQQTTRSRVLFEAFYSYLLPQLDRLDDRQAHDLFETLAPLFDGAEVRELGRTIHKTLGSGATSRDEVRPPIHLVR